MANFKLRDQIEKNRLKKLAEKSSSYSRGAYFNIYKNRYIKINAGTRKKFYKKVVNKLIRHEMKNNIKKEYNDYINYNCIINKIRKSKLWFWY